MKNEIITDVGMYLKETGIDTETALDIALQNKKPINISVFVIPLDTLASSTG